MPTETIFCNIVKKLGLKKVSEKLCPDNVTAIGDCWNCRAEISSKVPRRGYSNGVGRCHNCGALYVLWGNYGFVTYFRPGVLEDHFTEFFERTRAKVIS